MHESSLVQDLLRQVECIMREHQATGVKSLRVIVGEFSGVEAELFRSAYELLAPHSPIKGAELQLQIMPLEGDCAACGHKFAVEHFRFRCPNCDGAEVSVVRGEELILDSVTLEQD